MFIWGVFLLLRLSTSFGQENCPNVNKNLTQIEKACNAISCEEIPIGKSRVARVDYLHSPTHVKENYRLIRQSENHYKVQIPIEFRMQPDYDGESKEKEQVEKEFRARVNACVKIINPYLVGPDEKEIEIEVTDAITEAHQTPPILTAHTVEIHSKTYASNSIAYRSNADCPTIAHELMHTMGLVDEYQSIKAGAYTNKNTGVAEQASSTEKTYACRVLGPPDSLMRDQYSAFLATFPVYEYNFKGCDCNSKDKNICLGLREKVLSKKLTHCPSGSVEGDEYFYARAYDVEKPKSWDWEDPNIQSYTFPLLETPTVRMNVPATRHSLLYPGQFRAILYPNCETQNKAFYACAQHAYTPGTDAPCPPKDPICEEETAWLR